MSKPKNKFASMLHQYNKPKLFRIFRLLCRQTEIETIS